MFNFFGKSKYIPPASSEVPELSTDSEYAPFFKPEVNLYENAPYTIGVNEHGMTQILFRDGMGTYTLIMDSVGVRGMIRMLEATLVDNGNE